MPGRMRWAALGLLLLAVPCVAAQSLLAPSPHAAACFLDIGGDGGRGPGDPVFLQQACAGGVAAGDARLSASGGFPGGTLVEGQHPDAGRPTAGLAAAYAFHDADGSGAYSYGDGLFLAFGPQPGPLRPGDLPLTGQDAFASIPGDDPRVGWPLAAAAVAVGGESYQERDGTAGFTTQDALFLDLDGSGTVSIGDLRLAGPAPAASSGPTSPATATFPPTGTTGTTAATTASSAAASRSGGSSASPTAPGADGGQGRGTPALHAALLAGGLLLAARARRSH